MHLFADDLIRYGDDTALITEENERITYAELAARADAFGGELQRLSGKPRGLLMLEMRNTSEAIAAYLGALRARWPVILAAVGTAGPESEILQRFAPDLVYRFEHGRGRLERSGQAPADIALHPDLAVMLSTSGSTGSAKLVKLSHENIQANAQSIAEYLAIGPDRIAITDLPGHYSYGLSIINSFLESGAALALTEASVVEDRFWVIFDQAAVTDLAGVPYTYELLERLGFRDNPPASLKVMTQAGGRLAPELVERYAAFAQAADMRFFVMYGQTEATARMAYLPPELALENPTCIGLPIPRGTFLLRDEDGRDITDPLVPGELVYRGPNVMMGYAGMPADLADGPSLEALATGDIALRQENGLYRIVGRTSRFSKIAGLRIGHDDVEAILRSASSPVMTTPW